MADTYSKLAQDDLTVVSSAVTLYTAGPTETTIIKHIRAVNQSTNTDTAIRMWHGGTTDDELILPTADIAGGGWAEFEGTIILNPNESLHASKMTSSTSTTADITITVYGLEMTP